MRGRVGGRSGYHGSLKKKTPLLGSSYNPNGEVDSDDEYEGSSRWRRLARFARFGTLRLPMVLFLFVCGVTGLTLFQLVLDYASTRQGSLQEQPNQHLELLTTIERKNLGLVDKKPTTISAKISISKQADQTQDEYYDSSANASTMKKKKAALRMSDQDSEEEDEHTGDDEDEEDEEAIFNNNNDNGGDDEEGDEEDQTDLETIGEVKIASTGTSSRSKRSSSASGPRKSAKQSFDYSAATSSKTAEKTSANNGLSLVPPPQVTPKIPKTFVHFRGDCKAYCKSLIRAGYKLLPGMTSPAHPEFVLISYKSLAKYANVKTSIVNQVGYGSSCIGGGKGKQLQCKEDFARDNGCAYSDLGVQPQQWNIRYPDQCNAFFVEASKPENANQIWIVKPGGSFHGSGIKLYDGISVLRKKFPCSTTLGDGVIVQRYISKPALFSGHKFDFRTYMLIASMNPFIVFYHEGFVRKSEHPYDTSPSDLTNVKKHITNDKSQSTKDHFYSFEQLQERLSEESGFPEDFMESVFTPQAMRTTNFMFHASRKFSHRNARMQLFALDWMLDADGNMYLLEANGNPSLTNYPGLDLTPKLWTSMLDVVHLVQVDSHLLGPDELSVRNRYEYEGWKLVYNELEATRDGVQYNPCKFNEYKEEGDPLFSFE